MQSELVEALGNQSWSRPLASTCIQGQSACSPHLQLALQPEELGGLDGERVGRGGGGDGGDGGAVAVDELHIEDGLLGRLARHLGNRLAMDGRGREHERREREAIKLDGERRCETESRAVCS